MEPPGRIRLGRVKLQFAVAAEGGVGRGALPARALCERLSQRVGDTAAGVEIAEPVDDYERSLGRRGAMRGLAFLKIALERAEVA